MQTVDFETIVQRIVEKDPRYQRDAYLFIREALAHTQKSLGRTNRDPARTIGTERHVSGKELLQGIREYSLAQFGPMTVSLFGQWGIHRTEDFGELVFNLVEHDLLRKTEKDTREDFRGGYDFAEAFQKPFLPAAKIHSATVKPATD
jgi:uncharacterized repeat protein (TIGR04138 family)